MLLAVTCGQSPEVTSSVATCGQLATRPRMDKPWPDCG